MTFRSILNRLLTQLAAVTFRSFIFYVRMSLHRRIRFLRQYKKLHWLLLERYMFILIVVAMRFVIAFIKPILCYVMFLCFLHVGVHVRAFTTRQSITLKGPLHIQFLLITFNFWRWSCVVERFSRQSNSETMSQIMTLKDEFHLNDFT